MLRTTVIAAIFVLFANATHSLRELESVEEAAPVRMMMEGERQLASCGSVADNGACSYSYECANNCCSTVSNTCSSGFFCETTDTCPEADLAGGIIFLICCCSCICLMLAPCWLPILAFILFVIFFIVFLIIGGGFVLCCCLLCCAFTCLLVKRCMK